MGRGLVAGPGLAIRVALLAALAGFAGLAAAPSVRAAPAPPESPAPPVSEPAPASVPARIHRCPVCELWIEYQDVVARAHQEVGALTNGIVYFYHADDPAVIEPLLRFAYRRQALSDTLEANPELLARLGQDCDQGVWHKMPFQVTISTSAHGFFAILTSPRPDIVKELHSLAALAVPRRLPVWF